MRISHKNEPGSRRRQASDDTKMGLVLLGVAFLALGGYTLILFAGFIADMVSH